MADSAACGSSNSTKAKPLVSHHSNSDKEIQVSNKDIVLLLLLLLLLRLQQLRLWLTMRHWYNAQAQACRIIVKHRSKSLQLSSYSH
jgi:hypothetical protein